MTIVLIAASFAVHAQTTFHGNDARTGVFSSAGPKSSPRVLWTFKTDGPIFGSPAVAGGVVYIGSDDSFLYALDQETGTLKWKFETQGRIASSPAVSDGLVYFGSYDGVFYAVDAGTGKEKWHFETDYERRFEAPGIHGTRPPHQRIPDAWDFYESSPLVHSDRVYFGSGDGNVYSLDAGSGALRWKFHTGDVVHTSPAADGNTIYVGSFDTWMYAIDADNGTERWRFKTGEDPVRYNQTGLTSSPVVVAGTVYFGCRDAHVYAVDAATGRQKWAYFTDHGWVSATPAVRGDTLYIGTGSNLRFMALNTADGSARFSVPIKSAIFSSVALAGDLAYVGTMSGELAAYDVKDGSVRWQFRTEANRQDPRKIFKADGTLNPETLGKSIFTDFQNMYVTMEKRLSVGSILSSPVVDRGTIYFTSTEGVVYALR